MSGTKLQQTARSENWAIAILMGAQSSIQSSVRMFTSQQTANEAIFILHKLVNEIKYNQEKRKCEKENKA